MERRVLFAIFASFLVIYLWQAFFGTPPPKPAAPPIAQTSGAPGEPGGSSTASQATPPPPPEVSRRPGRPRRLRPVVKSHPRAGFPRRRPRVPFRRRAGGQRN